MAYFTKQKTSFAVLVSSTEDQYEIIMTGGDGNGNFQYGEQCKLRYTDKGGSERFIFDGWYNGKTGNLLYNGSSYTFTVTQDIEIEAWFVLMD